MISFNLIWSLLYQNGASPKKEEGTRRYWETLTVEQQQFVLTTITQKLKEGAFVHFDPIRAIQETLRRFKSVGPSFLSGPEQNACFRQGIPLVQVRYNDRYLICTRQTMQQFGLEYVRDWLPVE